MAEPAAKLFCGIFLGIFCHLGDQRLTDVDSHRIGEGQRVQDKTPHNYLKRLPPEYYRGRTHVHWSLTMKNRSTGWLNPIFYHQFREILTHTAFRFGLSSPIYCCMPDHIHLLWIGILDDCDQKLAMRFFRIQVNRVLASTEVRLQNQPYDHVLREDEQNHAAFETIAEYIARNPERKGLVPTDGYAKYPFTNCLVPGYPELRPFEKGYWDKFWRIYSHLSKHGLHAAPDLGKLSS